jgi:chitinase
MKGSLFTGKTAMTSVNFMSYAAGPEQLLAARQIGYIFTYMNTDTVWESFCDTYNGILAHLTAFDTYYPSVTGSPSNLAHEWPLFIRSELDMVVQQARDDLKMMNQMKSSTGLPFLVYWSLIMAINGGEIQKVRLARTDKCINLPASKVGAFIG